MYAFAGVVGAALGTGVDPKVAIDEMAKLEWRKDAVKTPPKTPDEKPEHPVFNDSLVRYRPEINPSTNTIEGWMLATGGGTRTAYERATRDLLEVISGSNSALAKLGTTDALKHLGLV